MLKTRSTSVIAVLFLLSTAANLHADTSAPKSRYSVTNADRPFTLPPEMAEVDITGTHTGMADFNASINASYGIYDDFQVNAGYDGVTLVDFEKIQAEKAFHIGFDYFLFESPYGSSMLDFDFPLYADTYFVQNIRVTLPTSVPISRSARVGLSLFSSSMVDFYFNPKIGAEIYIPARVGWQATDNLWLGLGTNFATFRINKADDAGTALGNDYIWTQTPLYVSALYGIWDTFDVTARIGFHDLQANLGESFYLWLGVGIRFGKMTE